MTDKETMQMALEANRLMEVGSFNKYLSLKFVVKKGNNHE